MIHWSYTGAIYLYMHDLTALMATLLYVATCEPCAEGTDIVLETSTSRG